MILFLGAGFKAFDLAQVLAQTKHIFFHRAITRSFPEDSNVQRSLKNSELLIITLLSAQVEHSLRKNTYSYVL